MTALKGLLRTMRPRQWTKNAIFVFPAIVFDGQLFNASAFLNVLTACILLILMSGTVYIINDLVDIEKDRLHPRKKNRPLPSGQLPKSLAIGAALVIPTLTLLISFVWNWKLGVVLTAYLLMQLAYSFYLKHVVVLDVLTVTAGFVLRVVAGVVVITVANFSPWLYATTGLLALFLVIGKRRQELVSLGEESLKTRPIFEHYNLALLDEMLRMVLISTFITYLLYTVDSETVVKVTGVNISIVSVPFVLYGLLHYMYLIHVKGEGGAPEELLLTDRTLQVTIVLWVLTFITLIYILPQLVN